ncbi:hypothetical protein KC678_04795 [Candidatus Dojkabacteria bacterium]|uniref:DUF5680 domain-containing protein n=1 Tax=Candidatus Dojkabacteria bacterium TaxID=2099670 RepID=A0A955L298_9BACT|nr:hypothetical protein [Candidatus Dojkabacteria bacterium]
MEYTIENPQIPFSLSELTNFIDEASLNSYATESVEARTPETDGYKVLKYENGDWEYEDKYTGYARSWGSETVKYKGEIVWKVVYGGGMIEEIPEGVFAHRGPEHFEEGKWHYSSKTHGDITYFHGDEEISFEGKVVFFHRFIGGLVIANS